MTVLKDVIMHMIATNFAALFLLIFYGFLKSQVKIDPPKSKLPKDEKKEDKKEKKEIKEEKKEKPKPTKPDDSARPGLEIVVEPASPYEVNPNGSDRQPISTMKGGYNLDIKRVQRESDRSNSNRSVA